MTLNLKAPNLSDLDKESIKLAVELVLVSGGVHMFRNYLVYKAGQKIAPQLFTSYKQTALIVLLVQRINLKPKMTDDFDKRLKAHIEKRKFQRELMSSLAKPVSKSKDTNGTNVG